MASLQRTLATALAAGGLAYAASRLIQQTDYDLSGRVVLITGGSRGLGLAMAEEFARRGARIGICARTAEDLEVAGERLRAMGAEVLTMLCDVSDQASVEAFVQRATERFGRVDVMVNNAGTVIVAPAENQTIEDFERAMGSMFWGTVYGSYAVLPQMMERGEGRIVNVTSIGGKISVPHLLSYNSAKFAAVGFSEGLSAEMDEKGVKVVTVAPSLMRTGSYINAIFKGQHQLEYTWFGLGAAMPIAAMPADKAARRIVEATRRGEKVLLLGWESQIAARVHGALNRPTVATAALVNRIMPDPNGSGNAPRHGWESETRLTRSFLTKLGREAAERYNQLHDHPAVDRATASSARPAGSSVAPE